VQSVAQVLADGLQPAAVRTTTGERAPREA
jgi:hypothetical protein